LTDAGSTTSSVCATGETATRTCAVGRPVLAMSIDALPVPVLVTNPLP